MKKALIVGGSNGIGLAIAHVLLPEYTICIIDKDEPDDSIAGKCEYVPFDLTSDDYSVISQHDDADLVMVTAGFGHLALFSDIDESMISRYFQVNTIPAIRIAKCFYHKLAGWEDFRFGVMVSIAGFMSSPFYSVYAATKAALRVFIESVNVELEKAGTTNRILNVSPGYIGGTRFNGSSDNVLEKTMPLAREIVEHLKSKDDLFIPQYDEIYHAVLERYHSDFRAEGIHSYEYKEKNIRTRK